MSWFAARKTVTVLFGDVVGFTERAEPPDVEALQALLSDFFSRAETEIERDGGTVENFVDDEVTRSSALPTVRETSITYGADGGALRPARWALSHGTGVGDHRAVASGRTGCDDQAARAPAPRVPHRRHRRGYERGCPIMIG